ncbi:hypothetical protein ADUPG1_008865 [Aduncisulcus paluster]|uniref:Uncharacterized protein n=1 Tax=Aduncisulcus paluster TaxID=2918883 RepID=A0ABQ5KUP4_9EUKA|nr:hypothetical protein ADUPG1_008865 [Aduncisulcus paluster]
MFSKNIPSKSTCTSFSVGKWDKSNLNARCQLIKLLILALKEDKGEDLKISVTNDVRRKLATSHGYVSSKYRSRTARSILKHQPIDQYDKIASLPYTPTQVKTARSRPRVSTSSSLPSSSYRQPSPSPLKKLFGESTSLIFSRLTTQVIMASSRLHSLSPSQKNKIFTYHSDIYTCVRLFLERARRYERQRLVAQFMSAGAIPAVFSILSGNEGIEGIVSCLKLILCILRNATDSIVHIVKCNGHITLFSLIKRIDVEFESIGGVVGSHGDSVVISYKIWRNTNAETDNINNVKETKQVTMLGSFLSVLSSIITLIYCAKLTAPSLRHFLTENLCSLIKQGTLLVKVFILRLLRDLFILSPVLQRRLRALNVPVDIMKKLSLQSIQKAYGFFDDDDGDVIESIGVYSSLGKPLPLEGLQLGIQSIEDADKYDREQLRTDEYLIGVYSSLGKPLPLEGLQLGIQSIEDADKYDREQLRTDEYLSGRSVRYASTRDYGAMKASSVFVTASYDVGPRVSTPRIGTSMFAGEISAREKHCDHEDIEQEVAEAHVGRFSDVFNSLYLSIEEIIGSDDENPLPSALSLSTCMSVLLCGDVDVVIEAANFLLLHLYSVFLYSKIVRFIGLCVSGCGDEVRKDLEAMEQYVSSSSSRGMVSVREILSDTTSYIENGEEMMESPPSVNEHGKNPSKSKRKGKKAKDESDDDILLKVVQPHVAIMGGCVCVLQLSGLGARVWISRKSCRLIQGKHSGRDAKLGSSEKILIKPDKHSSHPSKETDDKRVSVEDEESLVIDEHSSEHKQEEDEDRNQFPFSITIMRGPSMDGKKTTSKHDQSSFKKDSARDFIHESIRIAPHMKDRTPVIPLSLGAPLSFDKFDISPRSEDKIPFSLNRTSVHTHLCVFPFFCLDLLGFSSKRVSMENARSKRFSARSGSYGDYTVWGVVKSLLFTLCGCVLKDDRERWASQNMISSQSTSRKASTLSQDARNELFKAIQRRRISHGDGTAASSLPMIADELARVRSPSLHSALPSKDPQELHPIESIDEDISMLSAPSSSPPNPSGVACLQPTSGIIQPQIRRPSLAVQMGRVRGRISSVSQFAEQYETISNSRNPIDISESNHTNADVDYVLGPSGDQEHRVLSVPSVDLPQSGEEYDTMSGDIRQQNHREGSIETQDSTAYHEPLRGDGDDMRFFLAKQSSESQTDTAKSHDTIHVIPGLKTIEMTESVGLDKNSSSTQDRQHSLSTASISSISMSVEPSQGTPRDSSVDILLQQRKKDEETHVIACRQLAGATILVLEESLQDFLDYSLFAQLTSSNTVPMWFLQVIETRGLSSYCEFSENSVVHLSDIDKFSFTPPPGYSSSILFSIIQSCEVSEDASKIRRHEEDEEAEELAKKMILRKQRRNAQKSSKAPPTQDDMFGEAGDLKIEPDAIGKNKHKKAPYRVEITVEPSQDGSEGDARPSALFAARSMMSSKIRQSLTQRSPVIRSGQSTLRSQAQLTNDALSFFSTFSKASNKGTRSESRLSEVEEDSVSVDEAPQQIHGFRRASITSATSQAHESDVGTVSQTKQQKSSILTKQMVSSVNEFTRAEDRRMMGLKSQRQIMKETGEATNIFADTRSRQGYTPKKEVEQQKKRTQHTLLPKEDDVKFLYGMKALSCLEVDEKKSLKTITALALLERDKRKESDDFSL